jgi:hypothetical protein
MTTLALDTEKLFAARLYAARVRPYLATALFALHPVESRRIPTMAVDRHWRCYRVAGQCSALQGGGEGPRWEGRHGSSGALKRAVVLLGVLTRDTQRGAAGGACEARARPEFVGPAAVAYEVGGAPGASTAWTRP